MITILTTIESIPADTLQKVSIISQLIFSALSVLFIYRTYIIAKKVRREFLRNQALSKQMVVVNELIATLNDSKIEIDAWYYSKTGGDGFSNRNKQFNIFEIGDLLIRNEKSIHGSFDFHEFDKVKVIFNNTSNQICNIKKYINNPFLPKNISEQLMNFYSTNLTIVKADYLREKEEKIVVLKSGVFELEKIEETMNPHDYLESNALAMESWLNLKTHSNYLKKTFIEWFESNGIYDINLRIDYKN
jgi:hypothetical protein